LSIVQVLRTTPDYLHRIGKHIGMILMPGSNTGPAKWPEISALRCGYMCFFLGISATNFCSNRIVEMRKLGSCGLALGAALLVGAPASAAEWEIGGYIGATWTHDSDIDYQRPGLPGATFSSVGWKGEPFKSPIYYGVHLTRWFEQAPEWGIQIDFNHIKTTAERKGPVADHFNHLEFTDGLNIATVNALYRWQTGTAFTPYVGAGLGVDVPNVEVYSPGYRNTFEYQLGGIAAVAFAGIDFKLFDAVSLFGEYKFSYARVDADLVGGGSLETNLFNHHLNLGLAYRFDGP
jgi:lipid A oxidase